MTNTYQAEILSKMQRKGFNICSCGNCGGIILIDKKIKENMEQTSSGEGLVCPHCTREMAYSDCPDLYYEGCPDVGEGQMTSQERDLQIFLEDNIEHFNIVADLRGQGGRCTIDRLDGEVIVLSNTFGGISEEFFDKMVNKFEL